MGNIIKTQIGTVNKNGRAFLESLVGETFEFEHAGSVLRSGETTTWYAWRVERQPEIPLNADGTDPVQGMPHWTLD